MRLNGCSAGDEKSPRGHIPFVSSYRRELVELGIGRSMVWKLHGMDVLLPSNKDLMEESAVTGRGSRTVRACDRRVGQTQRYRIDQCV